MTTDPRLDSLSSYGRDRYNNPIPQEEDGEPSRYQQVYTHPALRHYVPSEKSPHLDALAAAGLLDTLTAEQCATIVKIAQSAYQRGKAAAGAERIDNDAVWLNGVGGLERQADGTWRLTMPDGDPKAFAAAELGRAGGSVTSAAKAAAARANGRKGGRPRKDSGK